MAATLVTVIILFLVSFATSTGQNCSVLYLLNVQPYPDPGRFSGFDDGLNLIPAAHLAAEEINNRSDILPEHHLEVIDIEAEACGRSVITKGLVNLYGELLNRDCIVGVMGFVCSTSTNLLAPIVGHPAIGYITLANSASPTHRNITTYPNLFHTISSASVHNTVIISQMRMFNWKRIGLVFNSETVFYRSTATDFVQRISNLPDTKLTTDIALTDEPSKSDINEAFNTINSEEARISYWLGNDAQYALFLCEAYQRKFIWPGYVYILRHNPHIITNILKAKTSCNNEQILEAMEGVILLDYRLYVDDDTELFSGWKFFEFQQRYVDKLKEFTNQTDSVNLTYATSFYDQVWTFALSLNNSLQSILSQNLSFSDYTFPNTETISNIIKQELLKLSFQGASGHIQFNENHEIPSFVNILQVQSGVVQHIATYDPFSMNITQNENFPHDIPPDTFETFYDLLPFWLGGCILGAQGLLFVVITTNLVLILVWRKASEIKAISPLLSILMMIGCYCLCAAPVFLVVYRRLKTVNGVYIEVLCYLEKYSSLGTDLILATLFWRMLRIYNIFHEKSMTMIMSRYWKDKYLFVYTLIICSGKLLLLIILFSVKDNPYIMFRADDSRKFVSDGLPPHYTVTWKCELSTVWMTLSLTYTGILFFMVVVLAIETRHVGYKQYRDTKKVNIFIFLVVILVVQALALNIFFTKINKEVGANVADWLSYFFIPLLCQVCLFMPKTLPLLKRYLQGHKHTSNVFGTINFIY